MLPRRRLCAVTVPGLSCPGAGPYRARVQFGRCLRHRSPMVREPRVSLPPPHREPDPFVGRTLSQALPATARSVASFPPSQVLDDAAPFGIDLSFNVAIETANEARGRDSPALATRVGEPASRGKASCRDNAPLRRFAVSRSIKAAYDVAFA